MVADTRSGKNHAANPSPIKRSQGKGRGRGGSTRGNHRDNRPTALDKAQQAAVEMYQATKAAYLNARDYDETKLSMKYLDQAISSFKIITNFLPWKVAISQYSDNWNPYKERTNLQVLRNNQEPRKAKSESSSKFNNYKIPKNKASGSKPYKKPDNKKKNSNKWKETFRMARVLMEVKDAINE
ncbi:hypothetical protein PTTG_08971 [Puccinia triticina 1-1 BBBD Race 1]|uniref:Uncharacterized protein n=1 Tax=Puccinia triticina (isolate 1-1 / race 1 (BBBD)) TaxID=630390 RepID=A0A180G0V3_PUCT1|nr:hypothetical protein PTTG_08971 [Puccinia triticina 1-1 BBBD Race 1]